MCIYVCMCVHVCMYMYVCACVYVHVCGVYVCAYVYVCACTMYACTMYVCVCMESFPMLQCKWCPWYLYVAPISSREHCYIHVAWEADAVP